MRKTGQKNILPEESKESWDELCEYVKKEILGYDDNMKFPKYLALKLQGLKKGLHIANNNIQDEAHYDNYVLLCAFKISRKKILDYLRNNETKINGEQHKINLIIKMVEPEINDIYIRMRNSKKVEEKINMESFDNQNGETANYIRKTKDIKNQRLKDLF